MATKIPLFVALGFLVVALLGYGAYRIAYRPALSSSEQKIKELEADIAGFQDKQRNAKIEIDRAKELAAKALEKSRLADARTEMAHSQAAEWRERYNLAIRQRDSLKRAQTGSEAVKELRRMGWVR